MKKVFAGVFALVAMIGFAVSAQAGNAVNVLDGNVVVGPTDQLNITTAVNVSDDLSQLNAIASTSVEVDIHNDGYDLANVGTGNLVLGYSNQHNGAYFASVNDKLDQTNVRTATSVDVDIDAGSSGAGANVASLNIDAGYADMSNVAANLGGINSLTQTNARGLGNVKVKID